MKVNINKFKVEKVFYDKKFDRIATLIKVLSGKVEINSIVVSEKTGCKYRITGDGFISHEAHKEGLRGIMLKEIEDQGDVENQNCIIEVGDILISIVK